MIAGAADELHIVLDEVRVAHYRAAERQKLVLAAGQVPGIFVGDPGELQRFDDFARPLTLCPEKNVK